PHWTHLPENRSQPATNRNRQLNFKLLSARALKCTHRRHQYHHQRFKDSILIINGKSSSNLRALTSTSIYSLILNLFQMISCVNKNNNPKVKQLLCYQNKSQSNLNQN